MTEKTCDEIEGALIFDCPKEKGIEIIIPIGSPDSNLTAIFFMKDEQAQEFINIIQNKLNARL